MTDDPPARPVTAAGRPAADPAAWWSTVDPARAPADAPAAFCPDLDPRTLLAAYAHGLFPLPAADLYGELLNETRYEPLVAAGAIALHGPGPTSPYTVAWWSPDPRPVIPTATGVPLSRRLRRRLRNSGWTTTADHAFPEVLAACAADRRPRWLTDDLQASLRELHTAGHAHSVEVRDREGELIAGAFGIRVGAVLSLDSMFHRRPDAARVALADLAARFAAAGGHHLDAQWDSPHIRTLGADPVPRADYLALLRTPHTAGPPDPAPRPAARLAPPEQH